MISDLPYGPIRPCDLRSFAYDAGKKFGWLRHVRYVCINPEGKPREKHPTDDWCPTWEVYIKSISKKENNG